MTELDPRPEEIVNYHNEMIAKNASRIKPGVWTSFKNIIKSLEKGGINRPDEVRDWAQLEINGASERSRRYAKKHGKELAQLALKDARADGVEINAPESGTFDTATKVKKIPANPSEDKQ